MDWESALKGAGRQMVSLCENGRILHLIAFDDGSLGLVRDGQMLGVWERNEEADCLAQFIRCGGRTDVFCKTMLNLRNGEPINRLAEFSVN
jgi:hypothetical protein